MGSTMTKKNGKRERVAKRVTGAGSRVQRSASNGRAARPRIASTPIGFKAVPPNGVPSLDHYHTIDWRALNEAVVRKGQCVRIGPTPTDPGERYQWEHEVADHLGMENVAVICSGDFVYVVPRRRMPGTDIMWWPEGYYG